MTISYDKEVDAMYIRLLEGEFQCRTVRLSDDIALNFAKGEQLVGIEILDAKTTLGGKGELPKIILENLKFATVN